MTSSAPGTAGTKAGYILALDQGTTSSRAIVFDARGAVVALAQQEFPQIFPAPGLVEHDPEAIWSSQLATAQAALRQANASVGATPADIVAIGVTNQRETTIIWERATGRPIYNAIVWQSRLTAPLCDDLTRRGLGDMVRAKTGLVIDPYFSGTKVAWLLDNVSGARERAERGELLFGTVDSFLIWRLSGGQAHVTDYTNASRTMLFNIHTLDWDDDLLRELRIPRALLPRVLPSSHVYAQTDPGLFGRAIPIAGAAGDQQAATFGQACFAPGMAKNTYGTGCFMLLNTGDQPRASQNGLLTTIAWALGSVDHPQVTYALEGSVFVAGAAVQWLRDGLGVIKESVDVETLARQVPDAGGVYVVPAFVGLGAPYWDARARGAILGLTRGTTAAHVARAVLDAMAYQTRDVLDAMLADSGVALQALRVDGGAAVNDLMMQFQADILGVPVQRPRVRETTALGAAYLAGLATGFWRDQSELASHWALERAFTPTLPAAERERLYARWRKAVSRARDWEEGAS
ncbi:MAG TPA: glycerol kinase GlpK [Ktedonobacterales bacterium]|nr:glycerol kinase GlpK [Ktedonobacterales bacterium]